MGSKSWFWNRNEEREEIKKKAFSKHEEVDEKDLPPAKAISVVKTKLQWLSKEIDSFIMRFNIDGVEGEVGFYLSIPFLFSLSLYWEYEGDGFRKKFPEISKNDLDVTWGFNINRVYVVFEWAHSRNYLSETKGFQWIADWVDLIKGQCHEVTWGKTTPVLSTTRSIATRYNPEFYKEKGIKVIPQPANDFFVVEVPIVVYEKTGTWHYKRWFNIKRKSFEVASGIPIVVPGKGENSWDQDDEVYQSKYDPERDTCNFSSGSKTAELAADAYIESIKRALRR